jgi:hypothetical protein
MILLNEENLIWCSGECKSCSVDQLVVFVPGKICVKTLKDHTSARYNQLYSKRADFLETLTESTGSHLNLKRERVYKTVKSNVLINFISILKGVRVKSSL